MDRARLKQRLEQEEGMPLKVYKDSLGNLTVGCGHFVTKADELKLGSYISAAQCEQYLNQDIEVAWAAVLSIFPEAEEWPELVQQVLADMAFQMGQTRLSTFHRFIRAVDAGQWQTAAEEMRHSLWYRQTPNRASRLAHMMEIV